MLRSSHVLTTADPVATPGRPRPRLRRSLSSTTLDSPRNNSLEYDFPRPPHGITAFLDGPLAAPKAPFMTDGLARPSSSLGHSRGASLDTPRSTSHSHTPKVSTAKPGKGPVKDLSPAALCTMLANTSSTHLDVEFVKKLRLMLRNETARYVPFVHVLEYISFAPSWSETFLQQGGYSALLTRLIEILEIEWRCVWVVPCENTSDLPGLEKNSMMTRSYTNCCVASKLYQHRPLAASPCAVQAPLPSSNSSRCCTVTRNQATFAHDNS